MEPIQHIDLVAIIQKVKELDELIKTYGFQRYNAIELNGDIDDTEVTITLP